jgi:hypothetical protein
LTDPKPSTETELNLPGHFLRALQRVASALKIIYQTGWGKVNVTVSDSGQTVHVEYTASSKFTPTS